MLAPGCSLLPAALQAGGVGTASGGYRCLSVDPGEGVTASIRALQDGRDGAMGTGDRGMAAVTCSEWRGHLLSMKDKSNPLLCSMGDMREDGDATRTCSIHGKEAPGSPTSPLGYGGRVLALRTSSSNPYPTLVPFGEPPQAPQRQLPPLSTALACPQVLDAQIQELAVQIQELAVSCRAIAA